MTIRHDLQIMDTLYSPLPAFPSLYGVRLSGTPSEPGYSSVITAAATSTWERPRLGSVTLNLLSMDGIVMLSMITHETVISSQL